jgi:hypothetical protein
MKTLAKLAILATILGLFLVPLCCVVRSLGL